MDAAWPVVFFGGCGVFLVWLHVGTMAGVARAVGARPKVMGIGFGPVLARFKLGTLAVHLRPVPFGGAVSFDEPDWTGEPDLPFYRLSLWRQAAILLGPHAVLLGLALLCGVGLEHFVAGFWQFWAGAIHPVDRGSVWVRETIALSSKDPRVVLGLFATKVSAMNLMPVPGSNSFQLISAAVAKVKPGARPPPLVMMLAVLLPLGTLGWVVAFGVALFR